jgi:apolipoprotein N-acyltransferase
MGTNIFLHPSWTWGDVGSRQFDAGAVRAVENGFTLFSCASDGESGVVSSSGVISARQYTGHNPAQSATFTIQLMPRVVTFYSFLGYLFENVCLVFTCFVFIFLALPESLLPKNMVPFLYSSINIDDRFNLPS